MSVTRAPSIEETTALRDALSYDPFVGILVWKRDVGKNHKAGQRAGSYTKDGYRSIALNRHIYMEHRVAWMLHTGAWPKEYIDHANGVRSDNRIVNLRECSPAENGQNRRDDAVVGAWQHPKNRWWYACIRLNGKRHYLGLYRTKEEASAAYRRHKPSFHRFGLRPSNSEIEA